jgi:aminoacrylate hydrolase
MPLAAGLYYEWHGPERGEVVLLSAGMGGSGSYWQPNLAALSERYRVLLYDHRGTGRSEPETRDTICIEDMARDVAGLMDALGVAKAHFVGHALGGVIGLDFAFDFHDRLDRLVVVNGWLDLDPHFLRCFDVRLELLRKSGPAAYVRAQPIFLYPAQWISRQSAELDAAEAAQVAHLPTLEAIERRVAALKTYVGWHEHLTRPILLVAAADDMLVPAHCTANLACALKAAKPAVVTMPWGGHACNVTDPESFNRVVLDFLRS